MGRAFKHRETDFNKIWAMYENNSELLKDEHSKNIAKTFLSEGLNTSKADAEFYKDAFKKAHAQNEILKEENKQLKKARKNKEAVISCAPGKSSLRPGVSHYLNSSLLVKSGTTS